VAELVAVGVDEHGRAHFGCLRVSLNHVSRLRPDSGLPAAGESVLT
jgi:hypothetical protein